MRFTPKMVGDPAAVSAAAVTLSFLSGACGSDLGERPPMFNEMYMPMSDAGRAETGNVDVCATPGVYGCPCDDPSAFVECGKILERHGDYMTCSKGHSFCDGKTWSECIGNRIVTETAVVDDGAGGHP